MVINCTKTVRELVVELPSATQVFERLGIDYCCGGGKTLEDACTVANIHIEEVVRSLVVSWDNLRIIWCKFNVLNIGRQLKIKNSRF